MPHVFPRFTRSAGQNFVLRNSRPPRRPILAGPLRQAPVPRPRVAFGRVGSGTAGAASNAPRFPKVHPECWSRFQFLVFGPPQPCDRGQLTGPAPGAGRQAQGHTCATPAAHAERRADGKLGPVAQFALTRSGRSAGQFSGFGLRAASLVWASLATDGVAPAGTPAHTPRFCGLTRRRGSVENWALWPNFARPRSGRCAGQFPRFGVSGRFNPHLLAGRCRPVRPIERPSRSIPRSRGFARRRASSKMWALWPNLLAFALAGVLGNSSVLRFRAALTLSFPGRPPQARPARRTAVPVDSAIPRFRAPPRVLENVGPVAQFARIRSCRSAGLFSVRRFRAALTPSFLGRPLQARPARRTALPVGSAIRRFRAPPRVRKNMGPVAQFCSHSLWAECWAISPLEGFGPL